MHVKKESIENKTNLTKTFTEYAFLNDKYKNYLYINNTIPTLIRIKC